MFYSVCVYDVNLLLDYYQMFLGVTITLNVNIPKKYF